MALRPCRECGKSVSTEAAACPHCGVPAPTGGAGEAIECRRCGQSISVPAGAGGRLVRCPVCDESNFVRSPQAPRSTGNIVAAVCSFFIPGLGQLVQGRLGKAILHFVLASVLWFVLLGWAVHIWSCLEASRAA